MNDLLPILEEAAKAISNWKVAGALASLAVLVGLLVRLSKSGIGQKLLKLVRLDGPTRRPWVAAILGGLTAALSAAAAKMPWLAVGAAAVTGGLAGWSATGANESRPSSSANRVILSELKPTNAAEVALLRKEVTTANAEPNVAERMKAKAALLDRILR